MTSQLRLVINIGKSKNLIPERCPHAGTYSYNFAIFMQIQVAEYDQFICCYKLFHNCEAMKLHMEGLFCNFCGGRNEEFNWFCILRRCPLP